MAAAIVKAGTRPDWSPPAMRPARKIGTQVSRIEQAEAITSLVMSVTQRGIGLASR